LVFLDESGVQTGMKRLYGRSPKGTRIVDQAPAGRWETHTVVAAIRTQGVATAMVTRKAINSITFLGFIEKFLCPTLSPGDVVVMDNLAVHKVKGVQEAIHNVGAKLWYLPPYSPDLNPIEQAWSKVKSVIRALCPPSYRRLIRAIGEGLRRIHPRECQNYFRNSGYPVH
jgi:transposase